MKRLSIVMPFAVSLLALVGCDQKVDEGDNTLTEGSQSILVQYLSAPNKPEQEVLFDNLETQYKFNDQPVVSLADIITGSMLVLTTDNLWLNFIGTDGYSPLTNDNCSDNVPTPGTMASQGYISRGTRLLLWEESLQIPQCLAVKDVAKIQIADDPAEFYGETDTDTDTDTDTETVEAGSIDVNYHDQTVTVQLGTIAVSTLDTTEVRLVSAIIEASGFGVDLGGVELSFEGSDGYNPTEEGTCTDNLPSPGSTASKAGIETATQDLYWEDSLNYSSCAFVKITAIIFITDAK